MTLKQAIRTASFYAVKMRRDYVVCAANGEHWIEPGSRQLLSGEIVYIAEPSHDSAIIAGVAK